MSAFFVTSSGTGIGKTVVMCALIRELRKAGVAARALKPVVTGFSEHALAESDTARILAALDLPPSPGNVAAVSPWRLEAPISPDMAASREGRTLEVAEIASFCREREAGEGVLLIEGIGGAMVPLTVQGTVLDLMTALGFPAILVVGSYLGTLSHTLTAAAALGHRDIEIAAVIVSESEDGPVPLAETVATLGRFLAPVPVLAVKRAGGDADRCPVPEIAAALKVLPAP